LGAICESWTYDVMGVFERSKVKEQKPFKFPGSRKAASGVPS